MKKNMLIGIHIIVILLIFCSACSTPELSLHATVSLSDQEFYITNIDSFTWYNTEILLNYEQADLSSGYKYKLGWMPPGWLELIHGLRIKNSDGKSFNPWLEEPIRLMIRADTEDGRTGTFVKKW